MINIHVIGRRTVLSRPGVPRKGPLKLIDGFLQIGIRTEDVACIRTGVKTTEEGGHHRVAVTDLAEAVRVVPLRDAFEIHRFYQWIDSCRQFRPVLPILRGKK